jgi:hypothetical protein
MNAYLSRIAWGPSKDFADACYQDHEKYGRHISTPAVARDMLSIVEALNEDGMLRYFGKRPTMVLAELC